MDEEIALREWAPLSEIINQIPIKVQTGLFSKYISITCIDVITEYLALGTNIGALFWYNRKLGQFEKFKCEVRILYYFFNYASIVLAYIFDNAL